jgi:hypothetical protein
MVSAKGVFSFQQEVFRRWCGFERQRGFPHDLVLVVDCGNDVITKLGQQLTKLSLTATRVTDVGYLHLKNFTR